MNKYTCSKCGAERVAPRTETTIEIKCCSGDTPVKHTQTSARTIVAVQELPKSMIDNKLLPPSTPLLPEKPVGIVPAKK
jgi:DNA-directed RNA polymerase subunit RPC12/RpoP